MRLTEKLRCSASLADTGGPIANGVWQEAVGGASGKDLFPRTAELAFPFPPSPCLEADVIAGAAAATLCPGNKLVVERPESSDGRAERLGTWPPGRLAGLLPVEPRSPGPPPHHSALEGK